MYAGGLNEYINISATKYIDKLSFIYQDVISKILMTNSDDRNAWKVHTQVHFC